MNMSDHEIKELLLSYIKVEMEMLTPDSLPEYDHVYSRRYQKKIKKLLWAEKYFGRYIYLGYIIRYAAMIALVLLSCFAAVKVSAELFGWEPWEYIQSFLFESRMDEKAYVKPKEESVHSNLTIHPKAVPAYVPDAMKETERSVTDSNIYLCWSLTETSGMQYIRTEIEQGTTIVTNGEYDVKKAVEIAGFQGYYYEYKEESWIIWDDYSYEYMITATSIDRAENELLSMADSLYE